MSNLNLALSTLYNRHIMWRDKLHSLGRLLSLALLVGIIGILVVAFIKYRNKRQEIPPVQRGPSRLGDQILAITEGYEYTSNVNGKPQFKVVAAKDVSYVSGRHELEKLEITGFDEAGKENGRIKSDKGEFQQDKDIALFNGHVVATNAEGLEVTTEVLKYDLKTQVAASDVAVNFKRAELSGASIGATLHIKEKKLALLKEAHVIIASKDPKGAPLDLKGDRADYLQLDGIVKFTGNAQVTQGEQLGKADLITGIYIKNTDKIERVEARGNSYLKSQEKGKQQEISAKNLDFFFDEQQRLLKAVASGKAVARSLEKDAPRELMAEQLEANYKPQEKTSELTTVVTNGRTVMKITPAEKTEKNAERVIEADGANVIYHPGGKYLARAEVKGNAVLTITPLVATEKAEIKTLRAPQFTADFFDTGNDIKTFVAETNAIAEFTPMQPDKKRVKRTLTGSKITTQLTAETQEVAEVLVDGNAKLDEGERHATAAKAIYIGASRTILMRGKPQVWDNVARTDAQEIDANLDTGESVARTRVRTTYYSKETTNGAAPFKKNNAPVFVSSDRATFRHRESSAKYEGNARAWQDDNFVRGEVVEVDNGERTMIATGNAQSAIYNFEREVEKGKKEIVPVFGAADQIHYFDHNRLVRYTNKVKIRQGTDQIDAAAADVTLDADYKMTRFVAQREVVLTQPMRVGKGNQLEYTAATDEAVLTGNLATIEDRENDATSKGARLTLHLRDAKITASDESGTKRVKTTHRIKKRG
ncbi:MAG: LPS export ABC transporter periplasmic protein LptC [Blastocatellia bacterium]|nr:LPS export ABC transporter periplasmic protein LptC [Blastocatellia bacterium]